MIEVETCMDDTVEVCCLSKGESGTQRVGVINWRSHLSTVKVRIRCLNEGISLFPNGQDGEGSYEYIEEVYVAPSKWDDINEYQLQIPARREADETSASETIQLSLTINTEKAAEDSREGPTLYSEIEFK